MSATFASCGWGPSRNGELGAVMVLALSLGALLGFGAVRLGRLRSEP